MNESEENKLTSENAEENASENQAETKTSLTAIKGKFKSPKEQFYGIFLLVTNTETIHIDMATVIVSIYSELHNITLSEKYKEIEEKIKKIKYEGQFSKNITDKLQKTIKFIMMEDDFLEDICEKTENKNTAELVRFFREKFMADINDPAMELEIELEPIIENEKKNEISPEELMAKYKEAEGVFLKVNLVLAPVGGKLVTEIKKGDKIMVRIDHSHEKESYFISHLGVRSDKGVEPMPATVLKLEPMGKALGLLLKLSDGIFGTVTEEEKVLVRMYEEPKEPEPIKLEDSAILQTEKVLNNAEKEKEIIKPKVKSPMSMVFVSLLLIFILILTVAYLLMS
ncbi:MAG: hypothetical protein OEZ22_08575 [Spirochaetia bacterium]|nr:hypothetical protein [Spirochaetia bacterium]